MIMKNLVKLVLFVLFMMIAVVFAIVALNYYGVNDVVTTLSAGASIGGFYGISVLDY